MLQSFCIIGNGGTAPSLYSLFSKDNQLSLSLLSGFPSSHSVYRVALSPSGLMAAAATKYGNIKVYELQGTTVLLVSEFQYRTAMPPHVTGMSFVDDEVLLVSGTDAKIRALAVKTKERLKLLTLPGIAFGLTAINNELFTCICRQGGSDHLMVWDLHKGTLKYTGPAFKINSEYLLAPLTLDNESGYMAHSDRYGNIYLYNINDDFSQKSFDTAHGDFYGLVFNKGFVFTGGYKDNGRIKQWSLDSLSVVFEAPPILNPVMAMAKFDGGHFITVTAQGQLLLHDYSKLEIKSKTQLNNIRHIAGLPASIIIQIDKGERKQYLDSMVVRIRELFESGEDGKARELIIQLENEGFDIEALKLLAMAEKAQGLLLGEMETLMMLLNKNPQGREFINIMRRLAEIFEQVHEPEMAIHSLKSLAEHNQDESASPQKIKELEQRCIPENAEYVLLTGFPSEDMIKPEFRKAELLGSSFHAAINCEPEKVSGTLPANVNVEGIADSLKGKNSELFKLGDIVPVILKSGKMISGPVEILRLLPAVDLPDFVELWVELRKGIDENKLMLHRVFYPHADDFNENWNFEMLKLFEHLTSHASVAEWHQKAEIQVRKAIVSLEHIDDEDDDFFSVHKSR